MTTERLLTLTQALRQNTDPETGELFGADSRLLEPEVRRALERLHRVTEADARNRIHIPDGEIRRAAAAVRALGYSPTYRQLSRLFYGSRTTVDDQLRALPFFKRYRGVYSRKILEDHLKDFYRRFPDELGKAVPRGQRPWEEVTFFREAAFDQLSEEKAAELAAEVGALPQRKADDAIPPFMRYAREGHPRAFEPWERPERALLVEAMCYTNQLERLSAIFRRSPASLRQEGQRLIWESRQRAA